MDCIERTQRAVLMYLLEGIQIQLYVMSLLFQLIVNCCFYFDPPYRPLNAISSFNSYVKDAFDDNEQKRLKEFYALLSSMGCHLMLSNSDCKAWNKDDDFFDELYKDFIIERVYAKRSINANALKRGTLTELLIRNYKSVQGIE